MPSGTERKALALQCSRPPILAPSPMTTFSALMYTLPPTEPVMVTVLAAA